MLYLFGTLKVATLILELQFLIEKRYFERVVDRLPLMTYGLKLSLEA